jgi:hypothetical protein
MDPKDRIVISLPFTELWDEHGPIDAVPVAPMGREGVRRLLRAGVVRFVVADPGLPLRWVPEAEHYAFWKGDVRPHIVDPSEGSFYLDDYPQGYAYVATEWRSAEAGADAIVVLECHH